MQACALLDQKTASMVKVEKAKAVDNLENPEFFKDFLASKEISSKPQSRY